MTAPTVLILGARGRLGAAAVRAFAAAGWRVRAQARRSGALWPAGVEPVELDALDTVALIHAAQGAAVIVNALNAPYSDWNRLARPLADAALAAARASGALLLFPGNVYNFGRALPPELFLDTPQAGDTDKARIRIAIEDELADAAAGGVDSVVLRAGDYFGGGGRGAWFDRVIAKSLGKGKLVYPGPPGLPHAWAYLPDLAQTLVRLAEQRAQLTGFHRFHFAGHTFSGAQLRAETEALLGRPVRLAALPWGVLRALAWLLPMPRALVQMRYLWQRPHRLDDGALPERIGAVPHTPLALALATSLRELGLALPGPPVEGAKQAPPAKAAL